MDIRSFQKLVVETVEAPLYAYLQEEPECGFSKRDIKKCKNLMFSYLGKLKKITAVTDEKILKQVKKTVLALNKLNSAPIIVFWKRMKEKPCGKSFKTAPSPAVFGIRTET